jgi:hypothetical protein
MSHELTLYFIPSPFGLSWASPKSITTTTILNHITFKNRNIGHVIVEIKTNDEHILTGMTGDVSESKKLLFWEGIGLGMLFYNYHGRLEKKEELLKELPIQANQKRLNFINFKISAETSKRLIQYLNEYKQRRCEVRYGLPNKPLLAEGGGCSAFAVSFLEVAGLLFEEFKTSWSYQIKVPEVLIGSPISQKKINFLKIFLRHEWAYENESHRNIFFWDPDTIYHWVQNKLDQAKPHQRDVRFGVPGLIYETQNIPTPKIPIWKR